MNNKEIIKDILSQRIKLLGYETNSVSNGKEAKEQRNPFDIIIMDLTIPGGMVGKKNNKKIFKIDKDAKVIISNGYANRSILTDYKYLGFINIIDKPYTIVR